MKILRFVVLSWALGSLGGFAFAANGPQVIFRLREPAKNASKLLIQSGALKGARALIPDLGIYVATLPEGTDLKQAISTLSTSPLLKYIQPDHKVTLRDVKPNDPGFLQQWNMWSASQVDVSATRAWDLGKGGKNLAGQDIVVAVVDGGVDVTHKDLIPNLWTNTQEIEGNGIDDDGNGYIDDVHGWNAFNHTGIVPTDEHATHVAGIVGAKGDNGVGVAGINWNVKLMSVAAASGTTSIVLEGYGYVLAQKKLWIQSGGKKGANIVATNSSFGVDYGDCGSADFAAWNDIYDEMGKVGILSAAATANLGIDVDQKGDVPTGCKSDYLITVTNTDEKDSRASTAAWGLTTIDLGAPGENILSTLPGNTTGKFSGTSMATPHVTGAVAFLYSLADKKFSDLAVADPAAAARALKGIMLNTVDQLPSLKGQTVSGGRLNLFKAAQTIMKY